MSPLDLQNSLEQMPEFKTIQRIKHFHESLRVFHGNHRELLKALDDFEGPIGFELNRVDRRHVLDDYMSEVIRLLHNFVAGASSLIDHARKFYKELYEGKETFPDYQGEVNKRFVNDPLSKFVVELRQYCQHYKTPDIQSHLSWTTGQETLTRLQLMKNELIVFKGWTAMARKFLDGCPDAIYLRELAENYQQHIQSFYDWFFTRLMEIHKNDSAAVDAKQQEARRTMSAKMSKMVEIQIGMYRQGMFGGIHGILTPCLGPDDLRVLMPMETHPKEWLAKALELATKNFDLAIPVVAEIRRVIDSLP